MEDFNEFTKRTSDSTQNGQNTQNGNTNGNLFKLVSDIAKKFDGKGSDELLKAIYGETVKGKKNGTLSNQDIDKFASMLSPILDDKKRKILEKVICDLKKI